MNRTMLFAIAALLVLAIYFTMYKSPKKLEEKLAPDFTTELIDGSSFSLSDLRGKYVILDFWGSWCAPCRRENPSLVQLYKDFFNKSFTDSRGFEVVTIALEKNMQRWKKAAEKDGFLWHYQIVRQARFVLLDNIATKYNVSSVPTKVLIGPSGAVIGVNWSFRQIKEFLTNKLA